MATTIKSKIKLTERGIQSLKPSDVNSSPNLTHLAVLISNLKLTHPQRFLSVI